jgi:hypothetical protein
LVLYARVFHALSIPQKKERNRKEKKNTNKYVSEKIRIRINITVNNAWRCMQKFA